MTTEKSKAALDAVRAVIDTVISRNGRCHDCADNDGTCQSQGTEFCDPDEERKRAAEVLAEYEEVIESALSAAPEVVTHNEFHRRYRASKHNDWQVYIEEDYPNGVRIVKGDKDYPVGVDGTYERQEYEERKMADKEMPDELWVSKDHRGDNDYIACKTNNDILKSIRAKYIKADPTKVMMSVEIKKLWCDFRSALFDTGIGQSSSLPLPAEYDALNDMIMLPDVEEGK